MLMCVKQKNIISPYLLLNMHCSKHKKYTRDCYTENPQIRQLKSMKNNKENVDLKYLTHTSL